MSPTDLGFGPADRVLLGTARAPSTHIAFPSSTAPRLLIPRKPASATATTLRGYGVASTRARLFKSSAVMLARVGMFRILRGHVAVGGQGTLVDHLAQAVGATDAATAVHLGPPRANRKPVIHLMDSGGRSLAFAKVGMNELTNRRVRREAQTLSLLSTAGIPGMTVPEFITSGRFGEHEYLLMRPLAHRPDAEPSAERRRAARRSLAAAFEVRSETLTSSSWWTHLRTAIDAFPATHDVERIRRSASVVQERFGRVALPSGAGHGDWSRWNMADLGAEVGVWDWERFSTDVPLAWDDVHYLVGVHPHGVAAAVLRGTPRLVHEVAAVSAAPPTAILSTYLIQRAVAYIEDDQLRAGARTGPLADWLLPALESTLSEEA